MPTCVVQQIAQCGDGQSGRHGQGTQGHVCCRVQLDAGTRLLAGVSDGQLRHLDGRAPLAVIEGHPSLHTGQHQQLLQCSVQAIGAELGLGQRPPGGIALGHGCDLQMGLDGRQRAAQLVGGVIGEPAFTFERLRDPCKQLILCFYQRRQFRRQPFDDQGIDRVGTALRQSGADSPEWRQAFAKANPEHDQTAEQGDQYRQCCSQQHRALERRAFIESISRGDAHPVADHGEGSPGRVADQLVVKAGVLGVEHAVWRRMAAREYLTAQRADLAGQPVLDTELLCAQASYTAFTQLRLRQLHQQPGDHPSRCGQSLIERQHQLVAYIEQHPGRCRRPEQHKSGAECEGQTQAQTHVSVARAGSVTGPAGPSR